MEPGGGVSVGVGCAAALPQFFYIYLCSVTVSEHCVLLLFQVQQVEPGSGVSVGVGRTAGISSLQSMWRGDDVSTTTDATQ